MNQDEVEGIAIIGLAGRFPGARSVDELWRNLRDGVESVTFFTDEELADTINPAWLSNPNYVKANAVLEDADMFDETFNFLHSIDISYLHVFTYSERDNTKALDIQPVVPMHMRHERNKILRNLSYQKMQYFTAQHAGETRRVLFEDHNKNGLMEGYTDNYLRITTPYRAEWANAIVEWKL